MSELMHHGILGQKWGIRRYQNKDGSLTSEGKERYSKDIFKRFEKASKKNKSDLTDALIKISDISQRINSVSNEYNNKNLALINQLDDYISKNYSKQMTEIDNKITELAKKDELYDRNNSNSKTNKALFNYYYDTNFQKMLNDTVKTDNVVIDINKKLDNEYKTYKSELANIASDIVGKYEKIKVGRGKTDTYQDVVLSAVKELDSQNRHGELSMLGTYRGENGFISDYDYLHELLNW